MIMYIMDLGWEVFVDLALRLVGALDNLADI